MIGALVIAAELVGVPAPLRKAAAWAAAIVAAALLLWAAIASYNHFVIARHEAKRELQAEKGRAIEAREAVRDAAINSVNEKDLHDAIDEAPKAGGLSPAAHALACERLRQRGRAPIACRSAGGDRGEAGS